MSRKPIQVTAQFDDVGRYFVLAICDDGTVWKLIGLYEGKPEWELFPGIPQAPIKES